MPSPITLDELDAMADVVRLHGMDPAGAWAAYHGRFFALPAWFDATLDPYSDAYREQQFRLWRAICGTETEYDPGRDEQAPDIADLDAVRFPAFYARRDGAAVASAGDHLVALGHLLKHCGLRAGDWALEYGAGFGQIALTLARLGVNVDTIDINPMFNEAVRAQAAHFGVPLRAFAGEFGLNPRPGSRYDLVLFYESFHHCADVTGLVRLLRGIVKPEGRILLAGEPIVVGGPSVPYPWGIRLDAETVAVMRWRHWLELGYQEDFLARLFLRGGFVWTKHPCAISHYGEVHELRPRPSRVVMSNHTLPAAEAAGWHAPEVHGRWTRGQAVIPLDVADEPRRLAVHVGNYHPFTVDLRLSCGGTSASESLPPQAKQTLHVEVPPGADALVLTSPATQPTSYGGLDPRELGLFVEWLELEGPAAG